MKIGNVELNTQLALAPMAGVTDLAFRTVCRELSGCYTVSEMVSAKALCYGDKKTPSLLKLGEGEHPAAVQIFGCDEPFMEKGAALALERSGADIIDINMGCPVPKVANSGDGSALMRDPDKAARVAAAVVRAAGGKPVTVKFRLGWDKGSINCVEFAKAMEEAGAAAVAVHGRTKVQMYSGTANWDIIDECARAMSVPVIGNGDISTPQAVAYVKENTAVSGVMIGRAAMENPWIFGDAKYYLLHGTMPPARDPQEKAALILRHARMALESRHYGDELHTMRHMRSRILAYTKGFPGAKEMRSRLVRVSSMPELEDLLSKLPRQKP